MLGIAALILVAAGLAILAGPSIEAIDTQTIPNREIGTICQLGDGTYMLGGGRSIGDQSWQTEPSISIYGGTRGENVYMIDGADVSDIGDGTVPRSHTSLSRKCQSKPEASKRSTAAQ